MERNLQKLRPTRQSLNDDDSKSGRRRQPQQFRTGHLGHGRLYNPHNGSGDNDRVPNTRRTRRKMGELLTKRVDWELFRQDMFDDDDDDQRGFLSEVSLKVK